MPAGFGGVPYTPLVFPPSNTPTHSDWVAATAALSPPPPPFLLVGAAATADGAAMIEVLGHNLAERAAGNTTPAPKAAPLAGRRPPLGTHGSDCFPTPVPIAWERGLQVKTHMEPLRSLMMS